MLTGNAGIRSAFRQRLAQPEIVIAPGIYDTLSALLAQQAGFAAVFFPGSALCASQLALPDVGLHTVDELVAAVQRAAERVAVPIVVDVDSAFGGAPQAARTMRAFERAGAAAVQVEDQKVVKPAQALLSRPLVSVREMQEKIGAMLDARESPDFLLSARTDAADPNEAIERCAAYREAGADLVFPEGMTAVTDLQRLIATVGEDTPVVYHNRDPQAEATSAAALQAIGISIVLFPQLALQSSVAAVQQAFAGLIADPSLDGGGRNPLTAQALQELLGSQEYLARFAR